MSSISKAINPGYNDEGDWYNYAPTPCIRGDDHNGNGDSGFALIACIEGDDDDDDVFDYAPAAPRSQRNPLDLEQTWCINGMVMSLVGEARSDSASFPYC
ncbi:hypothetical protein VNO77_22511 [Canavalia gladiata]|uniref:Uncharacterized protein n=1 Tax=Canavalia gladiata TaxID=3824 RepID=A0AAN9L452_CANGL